MILTSYGIHCTLPNQRSLPPSFRILWKRGDEHNLILSTARLHYASEFSRYLFVEVLRQFLLEEIKVW
jgi:hypothetical protein